MERFGGNSKLFIFGMICLATSLGLFFFCIYLLPYFFWEWSYNIPDFILDMIANYRDNYRYTSAGSKFIIWLIFFVPCLITGLISYFISRHLENRMLGIDLPPSENVEKAEGDMRREIKESASVGGKILGLMAIIIALILLLQYFVQSTV